MTQRPLFTDDQVPLLPPKPRATGPRVEWPICGPKGGRRYPLVIDGEETLWEVRHCGHPTALWPYYGINPQGRMILAPNGRGFDILVLAKEAILALALKERAQ